MNTEEWPNPYTSCDKLSDKMLFWREFLDIKEEEHES